jgi:hypothetical protein
MDILSILEEVEAPESSVTLCLKGSLVAEYERLDEQLQAAGSPVSLAGDASAAAIEAAMDDLRQQMLAAGVAFRFRALPPRQFSDYRATSPVKKDGQPDAEYADAYHLWVCGLVALCAVDPQMTPEQADQLSQKLSDAQWNRLVNSAWMVNANKQNIPFSDAAFANSLISGAKSRRQEQPEPVEAGSLAGSPSSEPSTSETTPAK